MRYDFKCTNKKCNQQNIVKEINCKISELKDNIACKNCGEEMSRVWSAPSIKTGDGVKG